MTKINEPTIDQINEAIALFMGYKKREKLYPTDRQILEGEGLPNCYEDSLKYHNSWNNLKQVIDEIFKYALAHPDKVKPIIDMSVVVDIKAAHEKVYQFCKWFNQQKQNNEISAKSI